MNTILIGGTGLIGSHTIQLFSRFFPQDKLICPVRSIPKETSPSEIKNKKSQSSIEYVVFDFENEKSLQKLNWKNVDSIICTLGTTIKKAGSQENFEKVDYHYPLLFAKEANKQKIPFYSIVTAMGSDANSSIFYNRVKGRLEEELAKLELSHLSIFQPSLLIGERAEMRTGEEIGKFVSKVFPFGIFGIEKYRPIEGRSVALAILQKLKHGKEELAHQAKVKNTKKNSESAKVAIYESDAIQEISKGVDG